MTETYTRDSGGSSGAPIEALDNIIQKIEIQAISAFLSAREDGDPKWHQDMKAEAKAALVDLIETECNKARVEQLLDLRPNMDTMWAGDTPQKAAEFVDRYWRALIQDWLDQLNYDLMTALIKEKKGNNSKEATQ